MIAGYSNIKPEIDKISFKKNNLMSLFLKDGRMITFPLEVFPEINSLTIYQRRHWQILGGEGFTFDDCKEVYHIEQVLGAFDTYKHK